MKTLLFLGDSITDCYHNYDTDSLGEGYVRKIAEQLGYGFGKVKVINKGVDGFTIAGLHRLWDRISGELCPDVITIMIGINDIGVMKNSGMDHAFALKEFKAKYRLLIQKIKKNFQGPLILMEPFVFPYPEEYKLWEPQLKKMNEAIYDLAKEYDLIFVPLWEKLLYAAQKMSFQAITTDGIHLTDLGHELLAQSWLEHGPI